MTNSETKKAFQGLNMRSVYFTANTFIYFSLSFIRIRNYLIGYFSNMDKQMHNDILKRM